MKEFWDERYKLEKYVFGETPNLFFKEELDKLKPGTILLPAEGEGRNAVYAAEKNWHVFAFDQSGEGKKKAEALAQKKEVNFTYIVSSLEDIHFEKETFNCIAFIYAHFPPALRKDFFEKCIDYLKPGGSIIFEGFSKMHLQYNSKNPQVGGPKDESLLFSTTELELNFKGIDFAMLEEKIVSLNEGAFHVGEGAAVRAVGHKKT